MTPLQGVAPFKLATAAVAATTLVVCSGCQYLDGSSAKGPEPATIPAGTGGTIVYEGLRVTAPAGTGASDDNLEVRTATDVFEDTPQLPQDSKSWFTFGKKNYEITLPGHKQPQGEGLTLSAKIGPPPSKDSIPVLHTQDADGYRLAVATYDPNTQEATANVDHLSFFNFGWFQPQKWLETLGDLAQILLGTAVPDAKCENGEVDGSGEEGIKAELASGNPDMFWLCAEKTGTSVGFELFSRSRVPLIARASQKPKMSVKDDLQSENLLALVLQRWISRDAKYGDSLVAPGQSVSVQWPPKNAEQAVVGAEISAPWYLVSILLKTALTVIPADKLPRVAAAVQSVDMMGCLGEAAMVPAGDEAQKDASETLKKHAEATVRCFGPVVSAIKDINPVLGIVWTMITSGPALVVGGLIAAWDTATGRSNAQYNVLLNQKPEKPDATESPVKTESPVRTTNQLRLHMGGGISDSSDKSQLPQDGAAALKWLSKRLGGPAATTGTCPSGKAKFYQWNNFELVVLTKDIEYEPEPIRAGTVGGWNVTLASLDSTKLDKYRIVGDSQNPSKYLTAGSTIADALRVFPEAEVEIERDRSVINYFAGDVTNIYIEGPPGNKSPKAKIRTVSSGVGADCN